MSKKRKQHQNETDQKLNDAQTASRLSAESQSPHQDDLASYEASPKESAVLDEGFGSERAGASMMASGVSTNAPETGSPVEHDLAHHRASLVTTLRSAPWSYLIGASFVGVAAYAFYVWKKRGGHLSVNFATDYATSKDPSQIPGGLTASRNSGASQRENEISGRV